MIEDLLKPLGQKEMDGLALLSPNKIGANASFFMGEQPDFDEIDIAIVGVKEERASRDNEGCSQGPDAIRKEFYQLVNGFGNLNLMDLGNIEAGAQVSDTYFALSRVVEELIKHKTIPVMLGGGHDLTYGQYQGYQSFDKNVNLVVIDEKIDLVGEEEEMTEDNFLMRTFTHQPNFLESFKQIGYQSYFTDLKALETLEKLNFECYRLGVLRKNLEEVEPIVRDCDLVSLDISAIRQSDAPGIGQASPNGFFGEEICQIIRYAGISDRLTSFGIYNYNPVYDNKGQTAQLIAQTIWYFLEGFYSRKHDDHTLTEREYFKYIVDVEENDHELVFWKNKKSDRWWLEIMPENEKKPNKPLMVPCSYADYQRACEGELPERWLKAYQRATAVS